MTGQSYDLKKIEELSKQYPGFRIRVIHRGHGIPKVEPNDVFYIKSTGGRWGKSSELRLGINAKEYQAQETNRHRLRPEALRKLQRIEEAVGTRGRLWLPPHYTCTPTWAEKACVYYRPDQVSPEIRQAFSGEEKGLSEKTIEFHL